MKRLVKIGYVAEMFGVSPQTIRNWTKCGLVKEYRNNGNHRRYNLEEIEEIAGIAKKEERPTVVYSRVSSYDQKDDLKRQTQELLKYCQKEKIKQVEVISDLGSGINYKKRGLLKLIRKVVLGEVKRIIINYKDRLVRFGFEILEEICRLMDVEIVLLHKEEKQSETSLVEDVLSILTVYSSKIYGKRSHQKKENMLCLSAS